MARGRRSEGEMERELKGKERGSDWEGEKEGKRIRVKEEEGWRK